MYLVFSGSKYAIRKLSFRGIKTSGVVMLAPENVDFKSDIFLGGIVVDKFKLLMFKYSIFFVYKKTLKSRLFCQ